ncbi:MAG: IS701 family transposase, partial [Candidatus Freyarchaeota archaeon]
MNPPKCDDLDYVHARCQPESARSPAHDAFTRLLSRKPPDTGALWEEVRALVRLDEGVLVLDDTTLDKPYASKMELVTYHWSGKHQRVVKGISLITL